MKCQFVLIALGLSIAVTACDGAGKRRVTLLKGGKALNEAGLAPHVKDLNAKIRDTKCLRVDRMPGLIVGYPEFNMTTYTANEYFGNFTVAAKTFEKMDTKKGAPSLLNPTERKLDLSEFKSKAVRETEAAALIPDSIDDKCATVTFASGKRGSYEIMPKATNTELWIRSRDAVPTYLQYSYLGRGILTITEYSPNGDTLCKETPKYHVRKIVMNFDGKTTGTVSLDKTYAQFLAPYFAGVSELKKAAEAKSGVSADISVSAFKEMRDAFTNNKFENVSCPQ